MSRPKTRASGEGTIYYNKARARWEAQVSYTDATGTHKRKLLTGPGQTEVAARLKTFNKQLDDGLLPGADKLLLSVWIDRWLTDFVQPKVRQKTYEKYSACLNGYIVPKLGKVTLAKLSAPDIQRVFNEMLTTGGKEKKGVSTSTVRATRRYLSMALSKAVASGIILRNAVAATDAPLLKKEDINPLTAEQANLLLKTAKDGEYYYLGVKQRRKPAPASDYHKAMAHAAILLALNTGMRLGEVFGLRWSDVDSKKGAVTVNQSLVSSTKKGMIFEQPKTKGSRRKISIPKHVTEALSRYQAQQELYKRILGDKYDKKPDLVFANLFGGPTDTSNFTTRYFKKMLAQAGLDPSFSFHDLRHTHATLLLKQGVNVKVVAERLGHSTVNMTLDTYSHLLPDMQKTAVVALDNLKIGNEK